MKFRAVWLVLLIAPQPLAGCGSVQYVEMTNGPTADCPSLGFHTFRRKDTGELDQRYCALAAGAVVPAAAPIEILPFAYPPLVPGTVILVR